MEVNISNDEVIGSKEVKLKRKKPGIIYLSTMPPYMNVTKVKEIFSKLGDINRVFLQPSEEKKKKKPSIHFTEGWIEFKSKRVAKDVALKLNNTLIGGKKKSKFYDYTWSMKYLPRFKWAHLGERLAYERAVHKQRLRAEIAQAKREASLFAASLQRKSSKVHAITLNNKLPVQPEEEETKQEDRKDFLKTLFT